MAVQHFKVEVAGIWADKIWAVDLEADNLEVDSVAGNLEVETWAVMGLVKGEEGEVVAKI